MHKLDRKFLIKNFAVAKKIPYRYNIKDVQQNDILAKPIKGINVSRESCKFLLILDNDNKIYLYYPFEKSLEEILLPNMATTPDEPLVIKPTLSDKKRLFAYTSGTLVLLYENAIKFFRNGLHIKSLTRNTKEPQKIVGLYGKFYILYTNSSIEVFDINAIVLKDIEVDASLFTEPKPTLEVEPKPTIKSFGYDCLEDLWVLEKTKGLQYYNKQTHHKSVQDLDEIVFPLTVNMEEKTQCLDLRSEDVDTDDNTIWSDLRIDADMLEGTGIVVKVSNGLKTDTFTDTLNMPLYGYVGEKLRVSITLKSSTGGTLSPTVYSVKVTINQTPYVEHLPAYYQEKQETLSPYLSMFQNLMDGFEEQIEKSHLKMLDPLCCDEEYLGWLSSLLGIARDYRWTEDKWRKFLDEAPTLYAGLGTKASMVRAIELYYGEEPEIKDDYGVPADESETCDSCEENNENCWFFCVSLSGKEIDNQRDAEVIASIIEAFKPAHTSYKLLVGYRKEAFVLGESFLDKSTQI